MIQGILLGSEKDGAGLTIDASLYRNGNQLSEKVESHLARYHQMAVISVHGCDEAEPDVVYHLDKFFDEQYRGITSDANRSQRAVFILTGAFRGATTASVKAAAAARFKKAAFKNKLSAFIPFD